MNVSNMVHDSLTAQILIPADCASGILKKGLVEGTVWSDEHKTHTPKKSRHVNCYVVISQNPHVLNQHSFLRPTSQLTGCKVCTSDGGLWRS